MSRRSLSPLRRGGRVVGPAVAAAALLLLTGCTGPAEAPTPTETVTSTETVTVAPSPDPGTHSPEPSATADPGEASRCPADALTLAYEPLPDESGAGQFGFRLVFTNTAASPCTLDGHPGVSYVGRGDGTQLGDPADQEGGDGALVTLAADGGTAFAHVSASQAGAFGCPVEQADGVRVYPPGSTEALFVERAIEACADPGFVLMRVGPVEAG